MRKNSMALAIKKGKLVRAIPTKEIIIMGFKILLVIMIVYLWVYIRDDASAMGFTLKKIKKPGFVARLEEMPVR
jgi:hypothetical protein